MSVQQPETYGPEHLMLFDAVKAGTNDAPILGWIGRLLERKDEAEDQVSQVLTMFNGAREQVQTVMADPVGNVMNPPGAGEHTLGNRLLRYLVLGKCDTRLGNDIALPGSDSRDKTLDTIFGVLRITEECVFDDQWPDRLPWLADDDTKPGKRFRAWETKAGDLADRLGAALGRTAAATAQGLISPFVKLPDEVVLAISFVAGITARKTAEEAMHAYLKDNPTTG